MAVRQQFEARDLARIAVFAALIVALGLVGPIPVPGLVPITAQTLGVMLAGLVLGPLRGTLSVSVVLVLAAAGMPVLSGGRGGAGVFLGPTAGYLFGWLLGAAVAGLIAHGAGRLRWWRVGLGAVLGGIVAVYAVGLPVQALVTGVSFGDAALTSLVFLPGDALKAALATALTLALARAYPPVFARPVREPSPSAV